MKKADDGNIYVVKTIKNVPEEVALEIQDKQEKLRLLRSEKRKRDKELKRNSRQEDILGN